MAPLGGPSFLGIMSDAAILVGVPGELSDAAAFFASIAVTFIVE